MCFSRKQQQILSVVFLLYGIWLAWSVYTDTQKCVEISQLAYSTASVPAFYIDPPVNVNVADAEELQLLPAIGPVLARRIIAYRERHGAFTSLNSLRNVSGIGHKTIQKLEYYLTFSDAQ